MMLMLKNQKTGSHAGVGVEEERNNGTLEMERTEEDVENEKAQKKYEEGRVEKTHKEKLKQKNSPSPLVSGSTTRWEEGIVGAPCLAKGTKIGDCVDEVVERARFP